MKPKIIKSEKEWKVMLTEEQYKVLRLKGTERPFSGRFWNHKKKGIYKCAASGAELFSSKSKFESSCGWPSFSSPLGIKKIQKKTDRSHRMTRTEILRSNCGSHLGHVFDDGPRPTGVRYCINSVSLTFEKSEE
ncbi:MAG: peptide-methionine (R)-S-oxide reductase MsrB [Candidatus Heimdallarchaeaceae archaeon]